MGKRRCIYSTRCWVDNTLQPASICFENEKISHIYFTKVAEAEDMGDDIIMPGIIDAHVHINEPGRTDWEGFDTGTQAAAAGGICTIIDMPLNASPVTTNAAGFEIKLQSSLNKLHVNVGFYGGLVPGNFAELEKLMQCGVLGIKCFLTHSGIDEFPNVAEKELIEAMPLIAEYNLPLLVHCELTSEDTQTRLEQFPESYTHYLASRPKSWENDAIRMMIRLCREHNCSTHIVHVSSADSLGDIRAAKAAGLPLTAETCAHYIFFQSEEVANGDTLFKCAPPIREKANNELLKDALANGTLDFITTDHSPAPPALKEIGSGDFQKAWGGIAGLQFLLPSSWTALKGSLALEHFIPLLTERPAVFLQIQDRKGKLAVGHDADFVIWKPGAEFVVEETGIFHRHKLCPYIGRKLSGVVRETIVNGETVYQNNKIILKNKGQWILRK